MSTRQESRSRPAPPMFEKQLAALVRTAPDAILGIDHEGRITIWNRAATNMFGYTARDALGKNLHALIVPARMQGKARRGLKAFVKTGKGSLVGKTTKCIARRKDGSEFPVELSISGFQQDAHWHATGIIRDISKQQKAMEALRASEEKFRTLTEQSPNMIFINQGGRVVFANRQCEEIMGYSRQELLAPDFDFRTLIAPEHLDMVNANFRQHMCGREIPPYECTLITRDGKRVQTIHSTKLIPYGEGQAILGVVTDISLQKKAAERIKQSERRVRLLLDSTAEGIYGLDSEGNCTFANAACCRLLGYDAPEELIDANMHGLIHHTWPDGSHYPARECHILKALRQGVGAHVDDEVLWRKDGTSFPAAYWAYPIFEEDRVVGAVVTFLDITEQVKARDALEESHRRLEASLRSTITAISKAVEARDPYTAGHQQRVARLACAIACEMEAGEDIDEGIRLGGLIHDIGKIHLPAEILSKPGTLSSMEYELIKSHTRVGYDILKDIAFPWPVADIAHQHHERLDGSGYPQGLKGDEICPEARIVAVADVVEAMSSHRPYRPALGIDAALKEIEAKRGIWFDPDAVDACLRLFRKKGFSLEPAD